MSKLFKYLKPMWWQLSIVMILLVGQAYLQLLIPEYMGKVTSILTTAAQNGTTVDTSQIWARGFEMLGFSLLILLDALFIALLNSYISTRFGAILREKLFTHIDKFSMSEFEKFGTSSLITRSINDVRSVQDVVLMGVRILIMSPTILVVAIIKIIPINPMFILIVLAGLPILIFVLVFISMKAMPLFKMIQERLDRVTLLLRESLTGVRVVRAFNQEKRENRFFDEANRNMTDTTIKVGRTMSFLQPTISTVMNVTYLAVYLVGFAILDNQPLSAGVFQTFSDAIVISQYIMHIMMSFLMFGMIFIMVPRASASANRILEVLNTNPSISDPVSPTPVTEVKGVVEFDHVSFKFGESTEPTLCDISFKTKPGTVTAIIGSTGSGKSTVINLIPRLYDVSKGSVKIDGVDVRAYRQNDLRSKIGFVPQQAQLFSGTIRENMLFGNDFATDEDIDAALEVAQAKHFVSRLENGLDTYVSQGGKNFSGGQKQRLSIARALVKKPEIYIFDDSFSALDFKTDIRLRTALKGYTKNASVIIVAQRVSSIIDADQIVVLHEGKVVGVGKHEPLLAKCKVYQEIVLSQLDADEVNKTIALQKQVLQSEGGDE